jgi:hypothetical protein
MDVNWLESEWWDPTTAPQIVQNLQQFLLNGASDSGTPTQSSPNWSGYAATPAQSSTTTFVGIDDQFTVPTVDCAKNSKSSGVSIWGGIDGFNNNNLVQAGIDIECSTTTAQPCYFLWTEIIPASENPMSNQCGVQVAPNDQVDVNIAENPPGSGSYDAQLTVTPEGGSSQTYSRVLSSPGEPDGTAECIVEAPTHTRKILGFKFSNIRQLAQFGLVHVTSCTTTADTDGIESQVAIADGATSTTQTTAINMGDIRRYKATVGPALFPNFDWYVTWRNPD